MKFKCDMVFLGQEMKESKKTGNSYLLAKFLMSNKDNTAQHVYEMYVPATKLKLTTDLAKLTMLSPVKVILEMSSFNGKPQIDLAGVEV